MSRTAVLVAVVLFAATSAFANGEAEAAPEVPVLEGFESASAAGVNVQWRVDGDTITVQAAAPTTGWVAVGFDPSRQMADANIIIGYVTDGEVAIDDHYGVGAISHESDESNGGSNDITGAEGEETDGATVIRFTIPLDSGDSMDKPLEVGASYRVIVAYGPDGADDFGTYHATRGSFEMEL